MNQIPVPKSDKTIEKYLHGQLNFTMDVCLAEINRGKVRENLSKLVATLSSHYTQYCSHKLKELFLNACHRHPLKQLLIQDPYTRRSVEKPRGYSGDAPLIDYLYRLGAPAPSDTYLGREIFWTFMDFSACQSVRWRALHLAGKIDEVFQINQKPINILSLASGHLRELNYVHDFDQKVASFYAIDQDASSNEEARRSLPYSQLDIREESILSVIRKKYKPNCSLDFIYSAGLCDYLNDKVANRLFTSCFNLLAPGGTLLVANFAPGLVEQAYMEAFMDWHLIYRDEKQMEGLLDQIPGHQIREIKLYRDPMENVVYLEVIKN